MITRYGHQQVGAVDVSPIAFGSSSAPVITTHSRALDKIVWKLATHAFSP